jgi:predicted HAD superfamily hydrolase
MEPTQQLTEKQRYWHEHIERARDTDNSLAAYAKEQNLDVKTLYHYQSVLRQKGVIQSEAKFTRLTQTSIIEQQNPFSDQICIQLRNGHRIVIPINAIDLNTLLHTVNAL